MRRSTRIVLSALAWALLFTGVVMAQGTDQPVSQQGQIALVLAPLLAAATAIERIIEMVFNWIESIILNLGDFLGIGGKYLRWSQAQVEHYRRLLVQQKVEAAADATTVQQLEDALLNAEERLVGFLKSPFYTRRKSVLTLLMGVGLGVVAALTARLQMFQLLGIDLARGIRDPAIVSSLAWVDMFLTGIIIGTGSAPVHSLIGILQQTRDAIDKAGELWSGKAFREVQEELRKLRQEQVTSLGKTAGEAGAGSAQVIRQYQRIVR